MHRKIIISESGPKLLELEDRVDLLTVEQGEARLLGVNVGLRQWRKNRTSSICLDPQITPIDQSGELLDGELLAAIFFAIHKFILDQQQLRLTAFGKPYVVNQSQQRFTEKARFFRVHDYVRLVVAEKGAFTQLLYSLDKFWGGVNLWVRMQGLVRGTRKWPERQDRVRALLSFLAREEQFCRPEILAYLWRVLSQEMEEVFFRLQKEERISPQVVKAIYSDEVPPFACPTLEPALALATLGIKVWHRKRVSLRYQGSQVFDVYCPRSETGE